MQSLYVHIPFCARKCFYCSFVVAVGREQTMTRYVRCLMREMQRCRGEAADTVYFGGGTPTLLDDDLWEQLFLSLRKTFVLPENVEITVEANPESLDAAKAATLFRLGVNRVSLGVQTLQDHFLRELGRNHDARQAERAFFCLRTAGFRNINLDLLYSLPGQAWSDAGRDVEQLMSWGGEHVSLYSLTVEENSRFFIRGVRPLPRSRDAVFYRRLCRSLRRQGYNQYEVSNFSRPLFESRHNLNYWQGGDYAGLGIGAHSHRQGRRSWNTARLDVYLQRVEQDQNPEDGFEQLTPRQRLKEALAFGLRMNRGVDTAVLQDRFRSRFPRELEDAIRDFARQGWLSRAGTTLAVTDAGRLVLDSLMPYLM